MNKHNSDPETDRRSEKTEPEQFWETIDVNHIQHVKVLGNGEQNLYIEFDDETNLVIIKGPAAIATGVGVKKKKVPDGNFMNKSEGPALIDSSDSQTDTKEDSGKEISTCFMECPYCKKMITVHLSRVDLRKLIISDESS